MLSYPFPLSKNDQLSMSHPTPLSFMILLYGAAAIKPLCFFEVALVESNRLFSDHGQAGVRRAKPACCRGCKSPPGKEVANPS
jgi:hypothetical protein